MWGSTNWSIGWTHGWMDAWMLYIRSMGWHMDDFAWSIDEWVDPNMQGWMDVCVDNGWMKPSLDRLDPSIHPSIRVVHPYVHPSMHPCDVWMDVWMKYAWLNGWLDGLIYPVNVSSIHRPRIQPLIPPCWSPLIHRSIMRSHPYASPSICYTTFMHPLIHPAIHPIRLTYPVYTSAKGTADPIYRWQWVGGHRSVEGMEHI